MNYSNTAFSVFGLPNNYLVDILCQVSRVAQCTYLIEHLTTRNVVERGYKFKCTEISYLLQATVISTNYS